MGNTDKFEMIANIYDTPERIRIAEVSSEAIQAYLPKDTKYKTAMDFGCGTGLVGINLLNEFKSMIFLDTSQNMLNQIKHKITNGNLQNVETVCYDFEKDKLVDIHVDYIFMVQVLLHIPEVESLLARLYEVLNEGGHLLIVDFDENENVASEIVHSGFDQMNLSDTMTKIGYRNIQSKTFYTGSNIFMGQDASLFILDAIK